MDIVSQRRYLGMLLTATMLLFPLNCMGQNYHAVLIGIGQYPSSSGWNTIHGDNDIPLIKASLINQGFPDENITTILNEKATKECIEMLLDLYQQGRADAIDEFARKLYEGCNEMIETCGSNIAPISWAEAYADFKVDIEEIAERLKEQICQ